MKRNSLKRHWRNVREVRWIPRFETPVLPALHRAKFSSVADSLRFYGFFANNHNEFSPAVQAFLATVAEFKSAEFLYRKLRRLGIDEITAARARNCYSSNSLCRN